VLNGARVKIVVQRMGKDAMQHLAMAMVHADIPQI
jgi:hypothetical protein